MSTKNFENFKSPLNVNYADEQLEEIVKLSKKVGASKSKMVRAITRYGLDHARTLNKSQLLDFIKE